MASEDLSVFGVIDDEKHGVTLPRIFTPPLRPLDKTMSTFTRGSSGYWCMPWNCWRTAAIVSVK